MAAVKIIITLDAALLSELDTLVTQRVFSIRSQALQQALQEKLAKMRHRRLAAACRQLDPSTEQALAEEGLESALATWPEY